MGQIVGHREGLCPLELKRVVEDARHRLEQHPHRAEHGRRQPGLARRRHAVNRHERPHPNPAARQRKGEDGRCGLVGNPGVPGEVGRHELGAALHDPVCNLVDRGAQVRVQAAVREHGQLARQVRRHQGPARRGNPAGRALDDKLGNPRGFEAGVHRPNDVDQGLAPLETAPKRTLERPQARSQVEARRLRRPGDTARLRHARRGAGAPAVVGQTGHSPCWRHAFERRAKARTAKLLYTQQIYHTVPPSRLASPQPPGIRSPFPRNPHDDARSDAPAPELAQVEPGAGLSGVCNFLHSGLPADADHGSRRD